MKRTTILYVGLAFGWLTACSESEPLSTPTYTVGVEENPIRLQAGIGDNPSTASTRALEGHTALAGNTAITLRVDGKWKKSESDETSITKYTTATAVSDNDDDHINALTLSPTLYWDDYGTADPANSLNRTAGLTIYGVAVDGETTAPTVEDNPWTAFPWEVQTDGTDVMKKDLLVGKLNLKFDTRNANNRLDLKHLLSKITVNLTAGKGFDGSKFTTLPKVTLTGNKGAGTTGSEYAITKGTVDLTTGVVSSSTHNEDKKEITAAVAWSGESSDLQNKATATALLFPKSDFALSNEAIVAKVEADGNIYYIKAAALRTAIESNSNHKESGTPVYHTLSGFHYVINVTVNKTDIQVKASIQDWDKIESQEVEPEVNVQVSTGSSTGSNMIGNQFDLYYSIMDNSGFHFDGSERKRTVNKGTDDSWAIEGDAIYWPTHTTHYFFRGVTALTASGQSLSVTLEDMDSGNPYVTVQNGPFSQYTSPSNLLMGKPETGDGDCGSTDHTPVNMEEKGICARTTPIGLTFRYMMSQVEVVLSTDVSTSKKVHLDAKTKVEITNCYTKGNIYLGSMKAEGTEPRTNYQLDAGSGQSHRLSIILPQGLTFSDTEGTKKLQFKVTVYKENATTYTDSDIDDIYYADIAPIKKQDSEDKVAPEGKWESGKHYVYKLMVLKSGIEVVAKLTDWTTVESSNEDVWL